MNCLKVSPRRLNLGYVYLTCLPGLFALAPRHFSHLRKVMSTGKMGLRRGKPHLDFKTDEGILPKDRTNRGKKAPGQPDF